MMRVFSFVVALLLVQHLSGQRIISFNAFESQGRVTLKFVVSAGQELNGYSVMRSIDSVNFQSVYEFDNTIGGGFTNTELSWTDPSPATNAINYYKIQLKPYETSRTVRIYVGSASFRGIVAFPNPMFTNSGDLINFRILNTSNLHVIGFIYGQNGNPERTLDLKATGEMLQVDVSGLRNGVYCAWVTDNLNAYSVKFIISR